MSKRLSILFEKYLGAMPDKIIPLKAHASDRKIYRVIGSGKSFCGVINEDTKENLAFIYFANYFRSKGLPVPQIFIQSDRCDAYLQEDLGDTTMFSQLALARTEEDVFPLSIENLYKEALTYLVSFQLSGDKDLDYSFCHQRRDFDREGMLWDMNYFAKSFLARLNISFDIEDIQKDFNTIVDYLLLAPASFFMYRDFQARNIMIKDDQLYFIDFQAGRRGALQYDVASLLYQSSAAIPQEARDRLLNYYISVLTETHKISKEDFMRFYNGFVVIRIFQALGTYGKQGLDKGKDYFVRSIKPALNNLLTVFAELENRVSLPSLHAILVKIKESSYV